MGDGLVVGEAHGLGVLRAHDAENVGGAGVDDHARVDVRGVAAQGAREQVAKGRLGEGEEERATEELEEGDDGGADRQVGAREVLLRGLDRRLHHQAAPRAGEDLVADPGGGRGVGVEGRHQAGADGGEAAAGERKGGQVGDQAGAEGAEDDGEDELAQEGRERVEGRVEGVGGLDGLEPEREVVCQDQGGGAGEEARGAGAVEDAQAEQGRWEHGVAAGAVLPEAKGDEQDAGDDEQGDDQRAGPGVGDSAPLQRDHQHYYGGAEEGKADEVEIADDASRRERELASARVRWESDQEQEEDGDGARGKVDVEAPAPRYVFCNGAADERTDELPRARDGHDEAHEHRSRVWWTGGSYNRQGAVDQPG